MGEIVQGPWQETSLKLRQLRALESGYLADVTILVQNETFHCHSNILCFASPKFATMLGQNELHLTDVEPRHFRLLLEIVYSGELAELQDIKLALGVGHTAFELQIHAAVVYISSKLREMLDVENVCLVLDFSRLVSDEQLHEECLKKISENAKQILKSASFTRCERSTLETILKQDVLHNVCELELISACLHWANSRECNNGTIKNHRGSSGPARHALSTVIHHLRFRSLSTQQFMQLVLPSKLLTHAEERVILCCLVNPELKMPKGFSNDTRPRHIVAVQVTADCIHPEPLRMRSSAVLVPLRVSLSCEALILGVELRSAHIKNPPATRYQESVEVVLRRSDFTAVASVTFLGELEWNSNFFLWFPYPFLVTPHVAYALCVNFAVDPDVRHPYRKCNRGTIETMCGDLTLSVVSDVVTNIRQVMVSQKHVC